MMMIESNYLEKKPSLEQECVNMKNLAQRMVADGCDFAHYAGLYLLRFYRNTVADDHRS
jgi:hypothetical protein